jgi:pimeloyl-ACP methyl ester carboxylesterase
MKTGATRRVDANGIAIAMRGWPGDGPAVVGIHGLTADHTCWASVAEMLRAFLSSEASGA